MDNIITYSFIIPHRNSPELLDRMIDSISPREDVEIIVVDDNSDECKRPNKMRSDVKIVYVDSGKSKGAGRARNIGISHANGKWLLFPDADDEYCHDVLTVLDKYADSDYEVVYFNSSVVNASTLKIKERSDEWNGHYEHANDSVSDLLFVKYFRAPWAKMILSSFVQKNELQYQECPNGNDAMFSFHVATLAKSVYVDNHVLYRYYLNPNSITRKRRTNVQVKENLKNLYKKRYFLDKINFPYEKPSLSKLLCSTFRAKGIKACLNIVQVFVSNYFEIKREKTEYWNLIKSKI